MTTTITQSFTAPRSTDSNSGRVSAQVRIYDGPNSSSPPLGATSGTITITVA